MPPKGPDAYLPQLDGLRALAAVAVVLHHNLWRDGALGEIRAAAHLGEAGVRLFFVLSGFLITGILLRARGSNGALRAFYARRFLRIFPLYYLVVVAVAAMGQPLMREELGWNLAYLENFSVAARGGFPGPPVSHLWTLSVEEQFYLLWPLVVLFAPRRALLPVALSTLLVAPASRLALLLGTGNAAAAAVVTTSCLDTLGAGAALAIAGRMPRGVAVPGLFLLGAATAWQGSWFDVAFRDTGYACVFAWVVGRGREGVSGALGEVPRVGAARLPRDDQLRPLRLPSRAARARPIARLRTCQDRPRPRDHAARRGPLVPPLRGADQRAQEPVSVRPTDTGSGAPT